MQKQTIWNSRVKRKMIRSLLAPLGQDKANRQVRLKKQKADKAEDKIY